MTRFKSFDDAKPKWEPVMVPTPVFESAREMHRWQDATDSTPRLPGEEAWAWMERIAAKAQQPDRLPYRDPGEEG